ncbi:ATP-binding cassette domain-containing protein [Paenibacillus albidus]|uniref:ATP-binding cassette domain-containing protein n=1 Tax=Paenibacillus albidus TaxID=2041023 RepID=UPI001BE87FAA|nr:ATP-binding cassette domain-containing protein [Paenibacillus albidus]MBT2291478.1 ATP-binding cassette domain-containing protein [Paenibacillus albidus]
MEIELRNINKIYKKGNPVLTDINISLKRGVTGLVGPNGAGKTTLMRIMSTIIRETSGSITFDGKKLIKDTLEEFRNKIGYMPQDFGFIPNFTVFDMINYYYSLNGSKKDTEKKIMKYLEMTNLQKYSKRKMKNLSGGMKRRVGLIQAMINEPDLLIIDEPTAGLDTEERRNIRQLLMEYGKEHSVLLSTHLIEDIENTCSNIIIIEEGEIKYDGSIQNLIQFSENHIYTTSYIECIEIPGIDESKIINRTIIGEQTVIKFFSNDELDFPSPPPSLEDAYLYIKGCNYDFAKHIETKHKSNT